MMLTSRSRMAPPFAQQTRVDPVRLDGGSDQQRAGVDVWRVMGTLESPRGGRNGGTGRDGNDEYGIGDYRDMTRRIRLQRWVRG
jgi:hypothetical protein